MNQPKGYLVAIGGAEDKLMEEERKTSPSTINLFEASILKKVADMAVRKGEIRIELVTTASSFPDEQWAVYKKAFKKLGCTEVSHLKITSRDEADSPKTLERLQKCTCVFFSGGDQLRLCSILGGTTALDLLKERYNNEYLVIAGTSAGAAAMSSTMICGGNADRAYMKGEVQIGSGFGFLQNVIIDTHFEARGRFGRLSQAIAAQPGELGIGLDEDTGVVIEKGNKMKVIGSSSVVIVDGSYIEYNNIADIAAGKPISVANMKVHVMACGDEFDLTNFQFLGPKTKTTK
ncbi:cyanophycinase [Paraflavisolibacter sp. H34]|uniref:cyanophycinase n=1 Tax=Huijunlia imazamoxiresistens TaxID=3127457 RepID=UPI00301B5A94